MILNRIQANTLRSTFYDYLGIIWKFNVRKTTPTIFYLNYSQTLPTYKWLLMEIPYLHAKSLQLLELTMQPRFWYLFLCLYLLLYVVQISNNLTTIFWKLKKNPKATQKKHNKQMSFT